MKRLVDIDDELLDGARRALGTTTIKDTVNGSLRFAGEQRRIDQHRALDELVAALQEIPIADRSEAW